jgi:hypothetical protein
MQHFQETNMNQMQKKHSLPKRLFTMSVLSACLLVPAGISILPVPAFAQITTASLSGTVTDQTGAIVPNAVIKLRNSLSGDTRSGKSNNSGFFTFAGVSSGDYSVTISSPSFQQLVESGIHLDPGDSRNLPSLALKAGKSTETITVEAETDVPLDSGERSDLITAEQIKHLSVEGRDVTELFKTLPGFAIANTANGSGIASNSSYDPSQVNVNGALGSYAANGNPLEGISLKLDGADITDPGNYGAAIQNVNYDMVAEVKVQVANFGADIANGPVVVSAVTKAGGNQYHGELYTYARTYQLDSTDALAKATGSAKDPDREVYPGFNVGGPVLIPRTNFNHNKALTFFAGAEDYAQRNIYAYGGAAGALVHALVPTANMRGGNFSASELQAYLGPQLYTNSAYTQLATVPTTAKDGSTLATPGIIPTSYQDPGFQAIFNAYPMPNQVATLANPYNWQSQDFINDDLWQVLGRVDLAISQKNHLFGRYTVERGGSGEPTAIYYNPGQLNTPGGGLSSVNSQSAAANLTTVITPTLTNQLFGNFAYLDQAFVSPNPSALTNYPYQGAFTNNRHAFPQLASYNGQDGLPLAIIPDYSLGPIFSHKFAPEGGDNVTKVWGTHMATFGVYVERITNNQITAGTPTNGQIGGEYYFPGAGLTITDVDGSTPTMSGNWVANNYEGFVSSYSQTNVAPQSNMYFWNTDFFATDSWKVVPKFTLNYGLRVEHLGLWNDAHGQGVAIFNPSLITSATPASPYPGFIWHALDPSLPLSGNHSMGAFVEPRFGFAWDIKGNGSTVLRGGWGEYRAHDSYNDAAAALNFTEHSTSVTESGNGGASLAAISKLQLSPANGAIPNTNTINISGTSSAITMGDREEPLVDTYSVTLNQALPWKMNLLVGYVGNNSRFLLNNGSSQTVALDNVNAIPIGGLYKPNPTPGPCFGQVLVPLGITPTGAACSITATGAGTAQVNNYHPLNTALVQYGAIDVPNHNLFANYNGLQFGLTRQTGRLLVNVNYTYSKAMGIQGGANNGNPGNPFNIYDDYGPESFDRTQVFNASYTLEVGSPAHNRFVGQLANGWEISGITNIQSGPDIVTTTNNPGFGLNGSIGQQDLPGGTQNPGYITISNTAYLGTPDVSLQPTLTCNPHSGLGKRQFINGNCFGTPNFGQNGPYQYPYLRGPAYFNTDLSAQKSFAIKGSQNIQFRISGFNFINHALTTFTGDFPNEYQLNLTNPNGTSFNQGTPNPSLGFGTAAYSTGRRVVELMAKYNF